MANRKNHIPNVPLPDGGTATSWQEISEMARSAVVEGTIKNGGHLASNLGAVELTIALHACFNPMVDRIVYDVGHQCYTHKWLTGRDISMIRTSKGPSGFPKRCECDSDAFGTGHASTSISAALGMARARDLLGQNHDVVAVVGDGALTGGMCYEALNDAGSRTTPLIVVLNDNQMSIGRNVGAVNEYLSYLRAGHRYNAFKRGFARMLKAIPGLGKLLFKMAFRLKNVLRSPFFRVKATLFESLGFKYFGPVDGHDIPGMMRIFKEAQELQRPVLIHVISSKGKGFDDAENDPEAFHGIEGNGVHSSGISASKIMGQTLCALAEKHPEMVAISAAMPSGTGLSAFANLYPKRFFDVGIAEEHALTMAAGMAVGGLRPVVALYSTFLQRGYDQLLHDVCLQNLPVVFCVDRCGFIGPDGETHQGLQDISMLRSMPNLTIYSPSSDDELQKMIELALVQDGPVAIRYPRGSLPLEEGAAWDEKSWPCILDGDFPIVATGSMLGVAMDVAQWLSPLGVSVKVYHARRLDKVDDRVLEDCMNKPNLFVLEDGIAPGGIGETVAALLSGGKTCVHLFCAPLRNIRHGTVAEQLESCGLAPPQIAQRVLETIGYQ